MENEVLILVQREGSAIFVFSQIKEETLLPGIQTRVGALLHLLIVINRSCFSIN